MMRAKAAGAICLAALTLGGCAIFGGPADRALRRTPSFRAGYADGCAAANGQSANPREAKDSLAGEDRTYRRGYASGFQSCRGTNVGAGARGGLDTTPSPGRP